MGHLGRKGEDVENGDGNGAAPEGGAGRFAMNKYVEFLEEYGDKSIEIIVKSDKEEHN